MKKIVFAILLSLLSLSAPVYAQDNAENVYIDDVLNDGDSLWLATRDGLVKYNKLTGETTFYTQEQEGITDAYVFGYPPPDNYKQIPELLPGNDIYCLTKDESGDIWMSIYGSGLVKFDGTKSILYMQYPHGDYDYIHYPVSYSDFILIDKDGNKWLGSGSLVKFDGSGFQRWGLPGMVLDTDVKCGQFDKQGDLWIGASSRLGQNSLIRFDGTSPVSYPNINNDSYTFRPWTVRREFVRAIEPEDDNVWIATYYSGLAKFDRDTTFTYYHAENSDCPLYAVADMKKDVAGNLWMIGNGCDTMQYCSDYVVQYDKTNFVSWECPYFSERQGDHLMVMDMDTDGTIWIGTQSHGLIKFSNGEFTQIDIRKPEGGSSIDTVISEGELVAVYYYNLQGLAVSQPAKGQVYIAKEVYQSGTVKIKKIKKIMK